MCPACPKEASAKGYRNEAWISGVWRISSRQPPLPANPFSKLLILPPSFYCTVFLPLFLRSEKKKQHKHKLFGPDFPRTFLTLTPRCGQKVSPHQRGRRKTHFLVRTSTIFGADVHDPKGSRKTLYKKKFALVFCPLLEKQTFLSSLHRSSRPDVSLHAKFRTVSDSVGF